MTPKTWINPPSGALGTINAVLTGTARSYYVPEFEGSLSIKTVVSGSGVWRVGGRTLVLRDDCFLVLNDRQRYTLTIESPQPTTTFCLFFARGFVEEAWRTAITPCLKLLDEEGAGPREACPEFFERVEIHPNATLPSLRRFYHLISTGKVTRAQSAEKFLGVATELVGAQRDVLRRAARIPAARQSTRQELCKRLLRGRDFLLSFWDHPLNLQEIARQACLSPYHFHRSFTQFFGQTPHDFIVEYRLARAATQLRHTRRSVTDLCSYCGFESLPSFSSLFSRRYGMSPRDYRRAEARDFTIRKIG